MNKPYAPSTLKKKYRDTGITPEKIEKVKEYLVACANFYKIIEIKDAWRVIGEKCGVTKTEFESLLPIFARDESLPFYIRRYDEFYNGCPDERLLIDVEFLTALNDEFDADRYRRASALGEEYDGPSMFIEDRQRFYDLDEQRRGKPLFIPADILLYADDEYVEQTQQVKAMRHFLEHEVKLEEDVAYPADAPTMGEEETSQWAVIELNDLICDVSVPAAKMIQDALECLKDMGYHFKNESQTQRFVQLFTDMSNHTRIPGNRGFTPMELMQLNGGRMPRRITFGPGLQNSIRSGKIDSEEMKRDILSSKSLPLDVRANLLQEVDKALAPGEEKWVGGTLVKGKKIGPNEPCPCGSGKKYKKCCGKNIG